MYIYIYIYIYYIHMAMLILLCRVVLPEEDTAERFPLFWPGSHLGPLAQLGLGPVGPSGPVGPGTRWTHWPSWAWESLGPLASWASACLTHRHGAGVTIVVVVVYITP